MPYVVRLVVPREGTAVVADMLRGTIEVEWRTVDMQVLVKSDGWPTYHLANVVDDHLMAITHVMRGEEWISSAPKHMLLYAAFGWEMPKLAHLPLLRNADKSKLSKRKNPTSILFYERMGYLPEALANFLGLFCVPPVDGEELMPMRTMVERFGLEHISLGGPVFDVAKLDWLNARYLRERLTPSELVARARSWAFGEEYVTNVMALAQKRIERLSDLGPACAYLFSGQARRDEGAARRRQARHRTACGARSTSGASRSTRCRSGTFEAIEATVRRTAASMDAKLRDAVRPFFVAITGAAQALPLFDSMALLGRDLVRERLRFALERAGGATNAEQDAWRAAYDATPAASAIGAAERRSDPRRERGRGTGSGR